LTGINAGSLRNAPPRVHQEDLSMTTGLDVFDTTLQHTNLWLKDLMEDLGVDRRHAYKVLSATLHAVRDRIGPENAVHLGAQLPILIRGFYYEGWRPSGIPPKVRHKEDFLDYVSGDVFRGLGINPERAVRAVLSVLSNRLDPGETEKLVKLFPEGLRQLWPAARGARAAGGGEAPGWRR
jgi:uncharacterized protein (DUF2267 family)